MCRRREYREKTAAGVIEAPMSPLRRTTVLQISGPHPQGHALAGSATLPGFHLEHPTALGGLPVSKPGLSADTQCRQKPYQAPRLFVYEAAEITGCPRVDSR